MRNEFDLSHEHKTTVDMGQLIPVRCEEVLPGDTFLHRATALICVAPLAQSLMHRVELRMHSFYIPNRVVWNQLEKESVDIGQPVPFHWEDFITGADPAMTPPLLDLDGTEPLWDYLGIKGVCADVDQTFLAAINMIWNDFYRDQELQTKRSLLDTTIPRCAWQKDYFTICRPQPQQNQATDIPVSGTGVVNTDPSIPDSVALQIGKYPNNNMYVTPQGGGNAQTMFVDNDSLSIDIDDFRRSIALQRFAEARMRYGECYIDYLRYLGINPSDGRLDRAEYLGGGKETLNFSEVLATAEAGTINVGDMNGHGIGLGRANGYRKMFEEHGWVITLLSARPKIVYEDAVHRKFQRKTFEDYWQKELEILFWQEVSQQEVDVNGDASTVFGYVPRYEEYRHGVSRVSSTMRGGTEHDWHMSRDFATPSTLNGSFVQCTPTDRIYLDATMPDLIINVMHSLKTRRLVGQTSQMGISL